MVVTTIHNSKTERDQAHCTCITMVMSVLVEMRKSYSTEIHKGQKILLKYVFTASVLINFPARKRSIVSINPTWVHSLPVGSKNIQMQLSSACDLKPKTYICISENLHLNISLTQA